MKAVAGVSSVLILNVSLFLVYLYYTAHIEIFRGNGVVMSDSEDLLTLFLITATVATFFLSLSMYLLFSIKKTARRMAYEISKDISFSKEEFRKFYELSPVPYLLIDSKGNITRPNKASLRFFKCTEEELSGRDVFSLLSDPDHKEKIQRYKDGFKRKIPVEQKEVQVQVGENELRWVLLSIENMADTGHSEHKGLVTMVDIHEQKELERIKTEFLSLASHQLRTPLSNLKWYIDFLLNRRRDQMSPEVQGYLQKMFRRNSDMIELVNTFLNLSRIEMGRVQVQKVKTDAASIMQSVIEELEPTAEEKNIKVETTITGDLEFETDERLLRIIFQNLLSNSLRYTMQGGSVKVDVIASNTRVRFSVKDTGVGIPPEEQGRIFSKLYRATNAQQIEANGNGIGLYMCKELVEGMGGTIHFESKLNEGTTFIVELPK